MCCTAIHVLPDHDNILSQHAVRATCLYLNLLLGVDPDSYNIRSVLQHQLTFCVQACQSTTAGHSGREGTVCERTVPAQQKRENPVCRQGVCVHGREAQHSFSEGRQHKEHFK